MAETIDGNAWLEWVKRGPLERQWRHGMMGTIRMPVDRWLLVREPLVLPQWSILEGPYAHLRFAPGLIAAPEFPIGEPLVRWEESRSQGEFGQGLRNVVMNCRHRAAGPVLIGDQESHYVGVYVQDFVGWGIKGTDMSHGATLREVSVHGSKARFMDVAEGVEKPLGTEDVGIWLVESWGVRIEASIQNVREGMRREKCAGVDDWVSMENVTRGYVTRQSTGCESFVAGQNLGQEVARWEKSSGCRLRCVAKKSATEELQVIEDGVRSTVATGARKQRHVGFEVEV